MDILIGLAAVMLEFPFNRQSGGDPDVAAARGEVALGVARSPRGACHSRSGEYMWFVIPRGLATRPPRVPARGVFAHRGLDGMSRRLH